MEAAEEVADSGIDSDKSPVSNDNSQGAGNTDSSQGSSTGDLKKKLEKLTRLVRFSDQGKNKSVNSRTDLSTENRGTDTLQPLVAILDDDSNSEEEFGRGIVKTSAKEMREQLKDGGFDVEVITDDESNEDDDLDLIPPKPFQQRWVCCPAASAKCRLM